MKAIMKIIILGFCFATLSSCARQADTTANSENSGSQKPTEVISGTTVNNDYAGTYKYTYEYNSKDLIEDHYIVLEFVNGVLQGRYYGTSDDFDEAREGYNPGFFVSNMNHLEIMDNNITFSIQLEDGDVFTKPIGLEYKSSKEISIDKNPDWDNSLRRNVHEYKGKFVKGEIQLDEVFGPRVFKKVN